jgi:acid phosphatase (class A)
MSSISLSTNWSHHEIYFFFRASLNLIGGMPARGCRYGHPRASSRATSWFDTGLLARGADPQQCRILPPPPADNSAKYQADVAASDALANLEGSPRWAMAARDAELSFPAAASIFSCALGIEINESATPALYRLMQRLLTDFGLASYPAKQAHQRLRTVLDQ